MRHQNRTYLETFLQERGPFKDVLEVGSLNVNGQVRDLFKDCNYIGADMRDGENVDVVINGHVLYGKFGPDAFDLVFSFDTLEHDDEFWRTWDCMQRVLRPGGWIMLAVPSRHCPEHDHPGDYWRFMPQAFREFFFKGYENVFIKIDQADGNPAIEDEIFGYAQKPL